MLARSDAVITNSDTLKNELTRSDVGPRVILYGGSTKQKSDPTTFLHYESDIQTHPDVVFAFGDNVEANDFFRHSFRSQLGEDWQSAYNTSKQTLSYPPDHAPILQGGGGQAAAMLPTFDFIKPKGMENVHGNWDAISSESAKMIDESDYDLIKASAYPPNIVGIPICMDTGDYKSRSERIKAAIDAAFDELEKHLENGRTIVIPALQDGTPNIGTGLALSRMGDDQAGVLQHLNGRVVRLQQYAMQLAHDPSLQQQSDQDFSQIEIQYAQEKQKIIEGKAETEEKMELIEELDVASMPYSEPKRHKKEELVSTTPQALSRDNELALWRDIDAALEKFQPGQISEQDYYNLQELRNRLASHVITRSQYEERQAEQAQTTFSTSTSQPEYILDAREQMAGFKLSLADEELLSFVYHVDAKSQQVEMRDDGTARAAARLPGKQDRHVSPISFLEHTLTDFMEPGMDQDDVLKFLLYQLDVLTFPHSSEQAQTEEEAIYLAQAREEKKQLLDFVREMDDIDQEISEINQQIQTKSMQIGKLKSELDETKAAAKKKQLSSEQKAEKSEKLKSLEQERSDLFDEKLVLLQKRETINRPRQVEAIHILYNYYVNLPHAPTRDDIGQLGIQFFKLFNERTEMIMRSSTTGKDAKDLNPTPETKSEASTVTNALKALAKAEWRLANALTSPTDATKAKDTSARLIHHNISSKDKSALKGTAFLEATEVKSLVGHIYNVFDYRPFPQTSVSAKYQKPEDPEQVDRTRYYDEPPERLYRLAADHLALVFVLCPNLQEQHQLAIMQGFVDEIAKSYNAEGYAKHPNWQDLVDEKTGAISGEKLFAKVKTTLGERYHHVFDNYKTEDEILAEDHQNIQELMQIAEIKLDAYSEQLYVMEQENRDEFIAEDDKEIFSDLVEIDPDVVLVNPEYASQEELPEIELHLEDGGIVDEGYGSGDEMDKMVVGDGSHLPSVELPEIQLFDAEYNIVEEGYGSSDALGGMDISEGVHDAPDAHRQIEIEPEMKIIEEDQLSFAGSEEDEKEIEEDQMEELKLRAKSTRSAAERTSSYLHKNMREPFSDSDSDENFSGNEDSSDSENDDFIDIHVLRSDEDSLRELQNDLKQLREEYKALQALQTQLEDEFLSPMVDRDLLAAHQNELAVAVEGLINRIKFFESKHGDITFLGPLSEHEDAKADYKRKDSDEDDEGPERGWGNTGRATFNPEPTLTSSQGGEAENKKRKRDTEGGMHDQTDTLKDAQTSTQITEGEQPRAKKMRVDQDAGNKLRPPEPSDAFRSGPVKKVKAFSAEPKPSDDKVESKKRQREPEQQADSELLPEEEKMPTVSAKKMRKDEQVESVTAKKEKRTAHVVLRDEQSDPFRTGVVHKAESFAARHPRAQPAPTFDLRKSH